MSTKSNLDTIDHAEIVIVGNGIAGLTAAVEARRLEPGKNIVIMTDQSHPTINTPALKQFAIGKLEREQLLAYPTGTERLQRIHIVNAHVEEIHAQGNYLGLSGGRCFGYGSLLLATGSRPTGLGPEVPGQDFDGVLTLHRLNDYMDLRRRLPEVEEIVVIGGGSHAVETVMGLLYLGFEVHWLIRSETFLPRMLDRSASDMVLDGVRRAGAKIHTETEVVGVVGRVGAVAGVVTTKKQMLPCQLVLVCTGTSPVTTLAKHCDVPMKHQQGILVDDQLRTSVRNIYAAGDVAALRDPLTDKYAPRAQWYAAVLQGRIAAASMVGNEETEGFGVPWHATRLGNLSMLTVGNPLEASKYATPVTAQRRGSYYRLSLVDDRLVGYLALGPKQLDSLAIKHLIDEGLSVRDIKKELLHGEFDARKYFSGKRSYAVQRMITTGEYPTPLPPVPGIIGGEKQAVPRIAGPGAPLQRRDQPSGDRMSGPAGPPPRKETPRPPITDPLLRTAGQGAPMHQASSKQPVPPPFDGRREYFSRQITWTGIIPIVQSAPPPRPASQQPQPRRPGPQDASWLNEGPRPAPVEPVQNRRREDAIHQPDQQFIRFPKPNSGRGPAPNPHPTRSLWHYTDQHPAIKRKNNVRR